MRVEKLRTAVSGWGSFARSIVIAAGLTAVAGCSSGGGGGSEGSHELIRVIQANPEFTAVDFDVIDMAAFDDVEYGGETGFFDVIEGKVTVAVKSERQVLPVVQEDVTIAAGEDYSIFFLDAAGVPDLVTIQDNRAIPEDGQFRIRVGNFAPSRDSVDIYIVRPGDGISDQTPLGTAIAYQAFAEYKGIDAGSYQIKYTNAGGSQVIRSTDVINFEAGSVYTHFLLDRDGGGSPLQSRLLIDAEY